MGLQTIGTGKLSSRKADRTDLAEKRDESIEEGSRALHRRLWKYHARIMRKLGAKLP